MDNSLGGSDYLLKIIVIGDSGAGKSCLLYYFVEGKPRDQSTHTIGVEFASRVLPIGGKSVKLQIWDTAGQERFRSITRSYYRSAAGCLLVYDITDKNSFHTLENWLSDVRQLASSNCAIVLVGNKKDNEDKREVSYMEASRFAVENSCLFMETSALSGENVISAFQKCSHSILTRVENGLVDPFDPSSGVKVSNRVHVARPRNNDLDEGGNLLRSDRDGRRSEEKSQCKCSK